MTSVKRGIKLAERVQAFQAYLGPLGLAHYEIERVSVVAAPHGNHDSRAAVLTSTDYDTAIFEFRHDLVDEAYDSKDFRVLDQHILHEWVHVAFQDFHNAIYLVGDKLSPDVNEIWEEAMQHANERLVDRIARQLYDSIGSDVVP